MQICGALAINGITIGVTAAHASAPLCEPHRSGVPSGRDCIATQIAGSRVGPGLGIPRVWRVICAGLNSSMTGRRTPTETSWSYLPNWCLTARQVRATSVTSSLPAGSVRLVDEASPGDAEQYERQRLREKSG